VADGAGGGVMGIGVSKACKKKLAAAGEAVPRTCAACGLGACIYFDTWGKPEETVKIIMDPYRSKTPEQALAHIVEECGEVLAAAGKTLRFGPGSINPELPEAEQETNIDWLNRELADLKQAIEVFDVSCREAVRNP